MRKDRMRSALCSLALTGAILPSVAMAQEGGGVALTFGISQGLWWEQNPDLATPATGGEFTSRTGLNFGLVSATPTQQLSLSAGGTLLGGAGRDGKNILEAPSATLAYHREGANSALDASVYHQETEVSALDFLFDTDPTGAPVVTAVSGTGTRRVTGAKLKLALGTEAPFGGDLSLGYAETDYMDTTDPSLLDSTRTTASLGFHLDLSEATRATARLGTTRLEETALAEKTTDTLELGLNRDLANGTIGITAGVTDGTSGTRQSLSFGRSLELPAGKLSASLGVAWPALGNPGLIGMLDWQKELARGSVGVKLSRSVTEGSGDAESTISQATFSLTQSLSPRLGANVALGLKDSRDDASGTSTRSTDLSASLNYALTEDWGLTMGASHRIRETAVTADSSALYLSISRNFEFRP